MAVDASILTANGTMYQDLGRDHFDRGCTDQQIACSNAWLTLVTRWRPSRLSRVCGSDASLRYGPSK
jgi:hypothetical protein